MELKSVLVIVILTIVNIAGEDNVRPIITYPSNTTPFLSVPENHAVNSVIFTCIAEDVNDNSTANGTISFNFFGGNQARKFSMDAATCDIWLVQPLDYEKEKIYKLTIRATDGGGLSIESPLTINVLDVNDNPPNCDPSLIWGTLNENDPANSKFASFNCNDPDTNQGGQIALQVLPGFKPDTIGANTTTPMSAYSLRQIDYDTEGDSFTAMVRAFDKGSPQLSATYSVILSIKDIDDNRPLFNPDIYPAAAVNENVDLGTTVVRITATDADAPDTPASLITFESSCVPDWLMIDRYSGDLIVHDNIDFEKKKDITCTLFAFSQSTAKTNITIRVAVIDTNDGSPIFTQSFYVANISEIASNNSVVIILTASDPENKPVIYSIDSSIFSIDSYGVVRLNSPLDYETQTSYLVSAMANDTDSQPLMSSAFLQVIINPVNEFKPVIFGNCSGTIPEDSLPGTLVSTVTAYDNDTGLDGALNYNIFGRNVPFYIDQNSGEIRVAGLLDFETTNMYVITVTVSDNSSTSIQSATGSCTIVITDVSDQSVECLPSGVAVVKYPFPIGQRVAFVNCSVANNRVLPLSYNITSGNSLGTFKINSNTGEVILLGIPSSQQYVLNIEVKYGTDTTNSTLIIFAEQQLTFTNLPATVNIAEGETARILFAVKVCCVFGRVKFTLKNNNDGRVTLTSSNGEVILSVPYDREFQDQYQYDIQVSSDSGQKNTSIFTVNVLDINDNAPEFPIDITEISVDESAAVGSYILTFTATDKDLGNNASLIYNISNGNIGDVFNITDTGDIQLIKSLDYKTLDIYQLEVTAFDKGNPPLSGTTLVVVHVKDSKLHQPQLLPMGQPSSVTLSEDAALGMSVFQIQATDNDTKSIFFYSILSGNTNNDFQIDPANGTIVIAKVLDRERTPSYALNLSATNQNGNSVSNVLYINISDVNDNKPFIVSPVYVFTILDQAAIGTPVGVVSVIDPDLGDNSTVTLDIINGYTSVAFKFSGLELQTNIIMNYANVNMYVIRYSATNVGIPRLSSTGTIVVKVNNSNIPFFNIPSASISVSEDQPIGFQVYDVNATSKGAAEDGSIIYRISSGDSNKDFNIRDDSGQIVIAKALDFETRPDYDLIITASNTAQTSLGTASYTLTITIENVNEAPPVFSPKFYSFNVKEDTTRNSFVGTILAYDTDKDAAGKVTETMSGLPDFKIEITTGVITVNAALNYLSRRYYSYLITATDGAAPFFSDIASVVINIEDVNTCYPVFTSGPVAEVLDSVSIGTEVFQVHATDCDTKDNGNVSYSFVSPSTAFSLNARNGILQTTGNLNALTTPSYNLQIRANDAGTPSLENITSLTIKVISTNPNYYSPVFNANCPKSVTISRKSDSGSMVGAFTATDRDNGISGEIEYRIISGNDNGYFVIDKLGTITTATKLAEAKNSYTLSVLAFDKGIPSRNSTWDVVVRITPAITKPIQADYTFTIPENTQPTSLVGTIKVDDGRTVSAFSIKEGNYDNAFDIVLNSSAGRLIVKGNLDSEMYPIYALEIMISSDAEDMAVVVQVTVTDVNDNNLTFAASPMLTLQVPENSPVGTIVAKVAFTDLDIDAINRQNILSLQPHGPPNFSIDQTGVLSLASAPDYETTPTINIVVQAADNQAPHHTSTLPVTVQILDVEEKETISPSEVTDSAVLSLEVPYQATSGHHVYTLRAGDFALVPATSASILYVAYQTISPFRIHQSTGDVTVSGTLANKVKYLLWAMIKVSEGNTITSRTCLIRIDTFDMATQMAVIEFSASYFYVQDNIGKFRSRAQTFFISTQRIGFSNIYDTSTGSRRRLLAQQSVAYTYVVANTSVDNMRNINEPKMFLTDKQILSVLQQSPDGTPVSGLSDPSVVEVTTVEPFEEKTTNDDFESFIKSPAGIAVFCLLGLFLLVLIVLIVVCIFYRKRSKNALKSNPKKEQTKKAPPRKKSFSKMSENPSFFNSTPQIIVSAPPPTTLQNAPVEKSVSDPDKLQDTLPKANTTKPQKTSNVQIGKTPPSQYGIKDGGPKPPTRKNKNKSGKPIVTPIVKSN